MARPIVTKADVQAAKGGTLQVSADAVVTEAARDLAERVGVTITVERLHDTALPAAPGAPGRPSPDPVNRCLVTAVGRNRPRVLAEITQRIGELDGNILDLSQRIVDAYFSTILIVDLDAVASFGSFKAELEALSRDGDYKVVVQHERIFQAMHRL
jgi:ACT domain-containing protein